MKKGYPSPRKESYLVIKLAGVDDIEFKDSEWDFRKLKNYRTGNLSAVPFTASLRELMKNKIK